MSSATAPDRPADDPSASTPDRTARARIRDAAVHLFGERGFRAATVRDIADRAGVSPALVLHHFGSKQGLREAVDDHLVDDIRAGKLAAMTGSLTPSGDEYRRLAQEMAPAMTYVGRALAEDTAFGRDLYDRLYADALDYVAAGVEAGVLVAGRDHAARTAVLLNNGLATLLLRSHLQRVLGVEDATEVALRVSPPTLDLYTDGLFTDDRFRAAWRAESDHVARTADPDPPVPDGPAPGHTA